MTLIILAVAALVFTIVFFVSKSKKEWHLGLTCLVFWGASIMWAVDGIFESMSKGKGIFFIDFSNMADDTALGILLIGLGMFIWLLVVLFDKKDSSHGFPGFGRRFFKKASGIFLKSAK